MRWFGRRWLAVCALAPFVTLTQPAQAAEAEDEDQPSILDSVPALSPIKAARDALAEKGLSFSGFYFSDPRRNLHGGLREGTTYSGLLKLGLDVDMAKIAGLEGGRIHADMLQIHGRDVSDAYVGNVMSANDIGARPTTRLFEFYYEQELSSRLTVKLGQLAADEEFIKSDYGEAFIGATLGWAAAPSENLPQGGPAYPLAAMGAQAAFKATDAFTLVAAIYNGTTARPDARDPEKANPHGLNFRVGDPPLVIVEGRYRWNDADDDDEKGPLTPSDGLPGALKFGFYAHFADFDDLSRGTDGLALGAPGSNGDPVGHDGNVNVYALLDQQIWRAPGGDPSRGVGVFLRGIFGQKDRNPIDAYIDGGLVAKGLVPGRPRDVAGLAFAYAGFSPRLADADRAANLAAGRDGPVHTAEKILEATYRAEIVPGLTVRPTFQYVWRPGGGPREDGGRRKIPDAAIFGVTTLVTF